MPDRDDLDRLLDSALSTYAAPAPDLKDRVLRSLRSDRGLAGARRRPRSIRRWLPWAVALPIAAALGFYFLFTPRSPAPNTNHAQGAPQSQSPAIGTVPQEPPIARRFAVPARALHRVHPQVRPAPRMAITRTLPKQNIFPSIQPLTPEEQSLVAVATHAPEPVRQSLIDAQTQADAPITISAIKIQPLQAPQLGPN